MTALTSAPLLPAHRPEVLAPAGDHATLRAALAAGADAVYFGLDDGFNARARATNFATGDLDDIVRACHRAGARAFLTLNTLIFEAELPTVEAILRRVAAAGVDALIVQDPAVALLAHHVAPGLDLHASTQMTISSPEAARFAAGLGVRRVVLPRELSAQEVRLFRAGLPDVRAPSAPPTDLGAAAPGAPLELEVFVHGALCMSWSGQCLTSEAWGGRSANRGQCAQSCRLPYQLQVDGAVRPPVGQVAASDPLRYLLSPSDLAGHEVVPELLRAGVQSLKIEGRLKGPAYVTSAVETLRGWVDAVVAGQQDAPSARRALAEGLARAHRVFSRGFTAGFLLGDDHRRLVDGRHPKHRGAFLGRVVAVDAAHAEVTVAVTGDFPRSTLAAPQPGRPAEAPLEPRRGMGVVFDLGDPEALDEPGGALFDVEPVSAAALEARAGANAPASSTRGWRLRFARDPRLAPDLTRVQPGHRVWVNSDPAAEAHAQRALKATEARGRVAVRLSVRGREGLPLQATLSTTAGVPRAVTAEADGLLVRASGAGLTDELLRAKLGALGGSVFHLDPHAPGAGLDRADLPPGLFVSPGALKRLRRRLVAALEDALERGRPHAVTPTPPAALVAVGERLRARAAARSERGSTTPDADLPRSDLPQIIPLCRQDEQLDAALELGFPEVELDWMEMVGLGRAVARAQAAGVRVVLATPRVQKPGEEQIDHRLARLEPHGVLVRHWGGLMWFADGHGRTSAPRGAAPVVHGDFSLNVTNSLTFWHLVGLGLDTVTASHDLDEAQLFRLLDAVDPGRLAVVVHHHVPTFHTEHCVYAANLSDASSLPPDVALDRKTCGQPCERHAVSLVDPKGLAHPVIPDVFCRNTVFEARAQSAAGLVPRLLAAGVRRLRVELVRESGAETATVLQAYRALLEGRLTPREVVRRVAAHEQFGVVRGVAAAAAGRPA